MRDANASRGDAPVSVAPADVLVDVAAPLVAGDSRTMTAARLGRTDAVDILMQNTTKNGYLACGCNAPLTCYLPGNGALLAAVSMMANLGAFPPSWGVVAEGFPPTL